MPNTASMYEYLPYRRTYRNDTLFNWVKECELRGAPTNTYYLFPIFGELDTTLECVGCTADTDTISSGLIDNVAVGMYSNIFPNPVKEELNVQSSFKIEDIEVYNSLSQRVFSKQVYGYNTSINTSSFEKGVYILKIKTQNGVVNKKFIVE